MTTDVKTTHPQIDAAISADWELMRHSSQGDSRMKEAGELYLPKPSGFKGHKDQGKAAYRAYQMRAQLPEIVAPTIGGMIGVIHGQEIQIDLPDALQFVFEGADKDGLPLEQFHKRITRHLLTYGRVGLMVDAPQDGGDPYLTIYNGAAIINWDDDFYVLDECGAEREGFKWKDVNRWRVLTLEDGKYVQDVYEGDPPVLQERPEIARRGGGALDFVPFVAASAHDVETTVRMPPLVGVGQAAKAIYQLSADYRWQLYMSGQETLVAINGEAPTHVGAGAVHEMHGADGRPASLQYVSPTCSGIDAHKVAIDHHREAAIMAGARMFQDSDRPQESGEARRMRYTAETANLMSVALSSCAVLERAMRMQAQWIGANPDDVVVTPPADLMDRMMEPSEAEALVRVWQAGAISYPTLYDNLQRGGIASSERTAEEEIAGIESTDLGLI